MSCQDVFKTVSLRQNEVSNTPRETRRKIITRVGSPGSSNIHRAFLYTSLWTFFFFFLYKAPKCELIHQLFNSPSASQRPPDFSESELHLKGIILVSCESKCFIRGPETLTVTSVVIHLRSKADTGVCLSSFTPQKPPSPLSVQQTLPLVSPLL